MIDNEALRRLRVSGYAPYLDQIYVNGPTVTYVVNRKLLPILEKRLQHDEHFYACPWHALHAHLGGDRFCYRAYKEDGEGLSLQIVVSRETGRGDADVDRFNTQDLVNVVRHNAEEVAWPRLKSLARKIGNLGKVVAWIKADRRERGEG